MKCIPTAIPEAFIIEPKVFGDERGFFFENLNHRRFTEIIGREIDFVQDNHIRSAKNVLRVVQSTVFDVAVDIRESPPTFGQPVGVELSADNKRMLWVPEFERSIAWNNPAINIQWPLHGAPTLSAKDQQAKLLAEAEHFA